MLCIFYQNFKKIIWEENTKVKVLRPTSEIPVFDVLVWVQEGEKSSF